MHGSYAWFPQKMTISGRQRIRKPHRDVWAHGRFRDHSIHHSTHSRRGHVLLKPSILLKGLLDAGPLCGAHGLMHLHCVSTKIQAYLRTYGGSISSSSAHFSFAECQKTSKHKSLPRIVHSMPPQILDCLRKPVVRADTDAEHERSWLSHGALMQPVVNVFRCRAAWKPWHCFARCTVPHVAWGTCIPMQEQYIYACMRPLWSTCAPLRACMRLTVHGRAIIS